MGNKAFLREHAHRFTIYYKYHDPAWFELLSLFIVKNLSLRSPFAKCNPSFCWNQNARARAEKKMRWTVRKKKYFSWTIPKSIYIFFFIDYIIQNIQEAMSKIYMTIHLNGQVFLDIQYIYCTRVFYSLRFIYLRNS